MVLTRCSTLLLCFLTMHCCAQVDLVNRTSARKDSSLIFDDMPNTLAVTVPKKAGWKLTAKHAQITPADSPWLFSVESLRIGPDTFSLFENGKLVLTKVFTVVLSIPVVRWGVLKTDTATVAEVIANRRMTISIPGCTYCRSCRIFQYEIGFTTSAFPTENIKIKIKGVNLTPEAAALILRLTHGDKITFSGIIVAAFDGKLREYPPFTIVIK